MRRAVDAERDEALDLTDVERRLPAGLTRDGEPVVLDLDFIDGTKGAHVNISGISGVATKTSYATFLLYSLFNSGVLGAAATNTKGLIFNVKGEDLLFLDHANTRLDDDAARPLRPARPAGRRRSARSASWPRHARGDPNGTPATGARTTGVRPLYWTIAEFCGQGLLPFLFADAEDERQQYTIVVQAVTAQLRQHAVAGDTRDGAVRIDGTTVRTFRDLVARRRVQADARRSRRRRRPALERAGRRAGARSAPSSAGWRRPNGTSSTSIRADLADAASHSIDLDAAPGHRRRPAHAPRPGQALRRRRRAAPGVRAKEAAGTALPLQFVVLDELNKYAPRDSSSPIKEILLDVAERGRSLGMILIGAQQTASEVERRVVANSAVRVVGRLDSAEAGREQYGFLPAVQRQRATILKPGSMFVSQPRLPVPLLLEFPFPAWATRAAEADLGRAPAGVGGDDPFAGLSS